MSIYNSTQYGVITVLAKQAEKPVTESFAFLTDIVASYDNTLEERDQIRTLPRQQFSYSIPLQSEEIQGFLNTAYGAIRNMWAIPLWTQAQYLGNVAAGLTTLACNTDYYDFAAQGLAFLYNPDNKTWQILEVESFDFSSITFTNLSEEFRNCFLMPCRVGYISGNANYSLLGKDFKAKLVFDIEDIYDVLRGTEGGAPDEYLGYDLISEPGLTSDGKLSRSLESKEEILDKDAGVVTRNAPWAIPSFTSPYRFVFENYEKVFSFKQLIFRLGGKHRAFWLPTFENNLRVAQTGNVNLTLTVYADNYEDYLNRRTHIFISTTDGYFTVEISNPIDLTGGKIRFDLSEYVGVNVTDINFISFLGFVRLDTDNINIEWVGNNVSKTELRIIEINYVEIVGGGM